MSENIKKILIVDDEPRNIKLLKAVLDPKEYECVSVKNGQEALEKLKSYTPDVMMVDVMMPVMDGFELTRKIKSNSATKNIPVILVTALSDRDTRLQGMEAGAEEFINKPFVKEELMMRLRNLFRLKHYSDLVEQKQS